MCRFPRRSLLVELFIFLGDCEVQAKGQSWGNRCGANGLLQKKGIWGAKPQDLASSFSPFPSS